MRRFLREFVGSKCPWCLKAMGTGYNGRRLPTRDHLVPLSKGGQLNPENRAIVCNACNLLKGNMTINEFYDWLHANGNVRTRHVGKFLKGHKISQPAITVME